MNPFVRLCLLTSVLIVCQTVGQIVSTDSDSSNNQMDIRSILSRLRRQIEINESDSMLTVDNRLTNDSNKSANISWDEINDTFNKYLSEEEVQHKWNLMEQNLKSGVRTFLRSIFPKIVAMSSDAKVSGNCSAGLLKWIVSLRHLKSWAVKMLDATGKPPSGIFEGVVTMFGNFEECVKVRVADDDDSEFDDEGKETFKEFFRGQFCVAEFKPWLPKKPPFYGMSSKIKGLLRENDDTVYNDFADLALFFHFITFRMDFCVPSTCTREDMQKISSLIAKGLEFKARVLRCETANDYVVWNAYQIATISILGILSTTIIMSTMVTLLIDYFSVASITFDLSIVRSLSLIHSWKDIFGCYTHHSKPVQLYGVRSIVLLWIIIVHTVVVVDFQYFREMQQIKTLAMKWPMQIFTNSLVQFECLILISAFSLAYYNVGKSTKEVIIFVTKKYLRVTPIIILIAFITILLPVVLTRGPLTDDFISNQAQQCQYYGLWNLFYVQNFFNLDKTCLSNTWIFCVEMQLSIAFIPLVALFHKINDRSTKMFWLLLPILCIIGFVINATIVYFYELPPNFFWTLPDPEQRNEYFYIYYYKPWTHLSVFAIGFYAGALRRISQSEEFSHYDKTVRSSTGWLISLVIIFALIYGCHDWVIGELPDPSVSAIYDATQKIFWSLANCWILFRITKNSDQDKHTLIEKFFSHQFFKFIGRLTLVAFLMHPIIQSMLLSSQQQHLYSSTMLMAYIIIGNIIFTYFLSFLISWTLEIPLCSLLKARVIHYHKSDSNGAIVNKCAQSGNSVINEIELGITKERL